jgi:predicted SprT family Zn-dependent metalloprotease
MAITGSTQLTSVSHIRKLVRETCRTLGAPELSRKIKIAMSTRMTKAVGRARSWFREADFWHAEIQLAAKIWPHLEPDERDDTIRHEVCHVIHDFLYGNVTEHHGPRWKLLATQAGCRPEAVLKAGDILIMAGINKRAQCGCRGGCVVSNIQYKKMISGKRAYKCTKCQVLVKPED